MRSEAEADLRDANVSEEEEAEIRDPSMKFYISATGIKRLAVSSSVAAGGEWRGMKWKNSLPAAGKRRLSHRTIRLFVGLLLPFLLFRTAFLVLESAALCSSPIGNFNLSLSLLRLISLGQFRKYWLSCMGKIVILQVV